jgi:hypothetical protein
LVDPETSRIKILLSLGGNRLNNVGPAEAGSGLKQENKVPTKIEQARTETLL